MSSQPAPDEIVAVGSLPEVVRRYLELALPGEPAPRRVAASCRLRGRRFILKIVSALPP
jgi:hypothetical protein